MRGDAARRELDASAMQMRCAVGSHDLQCRRSLSHDLARPTQEDLGGESLKETGCLGDTDVMLEQYVYIHTYIYVYMSIYIYTYIYIYRERERDVYIYVYI